MSRLLHITLTNRLYRLSPAARNSFPAVWNHYNIGRYKSIQLHHTLTNQISQRSFSSKPSSSDTTTSNNTNSSDNTQSESTHDNEYNDEDVTANARANSDRTHGGTLLSRWLRRLIILALIISYPYSVIKYNTPLPFQANVIDSIVEHGEQSKYWPWLKLYIFSPNFIQEFTSNPQLIQQLIHILNQPITIHNTSIKSDIVTILVAICMQPDYDVLRDQLASQPGLTRALLDLAMSNDIDKELSAYSFQTIGKLILNKSARDEFVASRGLQQTCRATRARAPEVSNAATEVLTNLLIDFPNPKLMNLSTTELNNIFMCVANLAAMYQENNQLEASVAAFKQALLIDSANTAIMSQIGTELVKLNRVDEAVTFYRRALKLDPGHIDSAFYLSKLLIGKQLHDGMNIESNKLTEISTILSTAIDTYNSPALQQQRAVHEPSPLLSSAYNLLIRTYEQLNDYSSALDYCSDWILRSPADAIAHYTYGRLLCNNKKYRDGLHELLLASKFDPTRPDIDYQIANAQYKQHNIPHAINTLQQCVQKYNVDHKHTDPTLLDKINLLYAKIHYQQHQYNDSLQKLYQIKKPSIESTLLHIKLAQQLHDNNHLIQSQTQLCQQLLSKPHLLQPKKQNIKLRTLVKNINTQCHKSVPSPSDTDHSNDYINMCNICSTLKLN